MATSFKNIMPNFIENLVISPDGTNPTFKTIIGFGNCRDDTDSCFIVSEGNITIDITASGANGLDTGAETSDTWYAVHIVADSTGTNSPAGLYSISGTSPTLPSGYDCFRRVGWVRNNDTSDFLLFIQRHKGNTRRYYYNEPPTSTRVLQNGNSTTWATISLANFVTPTSENVLLNVQFSTSASGSASDVIVIKPPDILNSAIRVGPGIVNTSKMSLTEETATDSSQQIDYKVSDTNNQASIIVKGFDDEL